MRAIDKDAWIPYSPEPATGARHPEERPAPGHPACTLWPRPRAGQGATMSEQTVTRMSLPCPDCEVRQRLPAVVETSSEDASGSGGRVRAVVRECPRCWSRRAQALNAARATLRARRDLGSAGGKLTWRGAILDGEDDALMGALLSALIREGLRLSPRMELTLCLREAAVPVGSREPSR